jgi:8-oxo-dGTP pyrophosphatase MutT (NUDIX family)
MRTKLNLTSQNVDDIVSDYHKDTDDFSSLPKDRIKSVCAFCYCDGRFVIVNNGGLWQPVAGHVEDGETYEEALLREIKEESNMKVLKFYPIGYLYVKEDDFYQVRYFCITEPFGPFTKDPDGGVSEIKLIAPADLEKYVDKDDTSLLMKKSCLDIIKNKY